MADAMATNSNKGGSSRWIRVSDCSSPDEIGNVIGLTFDLDWACDAVIHDTIDLVDQAGAPATWFVTHNTPTLDRLRANPKYELGIHPNFNPLLAGTNSPGVEAVIDALLEIVPEAKSVRSHSMVQSSRLMDLFLNKGLTFDCNHFIPEQSKIELRPWRLWNGLVKVPHFWEDDATCIYINNSGINELVKRNGLKLFDFHPIHVFLNTEDLSLYEQTRAYHSDAKTLLAYRYSGIGTRNYLKQLLDVYNNY